MSIIKKLKEHYFLIGVLIVTIIAFLPLFSAEFVNWDDPDYIYENTIILNANWHSFFDTLILLFTEQVRSIYTPLTLLSYTLDKFLFGLDFSAGWHITNLVLHLINVYLVCGIFKYIKLNRFVIIGIVLLFAIHPMHVESVAWLTERKDLLYSTFYFLGVLLYIKPETDRSHHLSIGIWLCFLLALLTKVQAVLFPITLILIDYWTSGSLRVKDVIGKLPFLIVSLVYGIISILFAESNDAVIWPETLSDWGHNIVCALYATMQYLIKTVIPYELLPVYEYPSHLTIHHWLSIPVFIFIIGLLIRAYQKRWKVIFFGLSFFLVHISVTLQIVPIGQAYLADRFSYVSYLGLFMIISYAAYSIREKTGYKQLLNFAYLAFLLMLGYMTYSQSKVWTNSETLWSHQLQHDADYDMAYLNLANFYKENGRTLEFESALLKGIEISDQNPSTLSELGKFYAAFNDPDKLQSSLTLFNQIISIDSSYSGVYINRAVTLAKLNRPHAALLDLDHAVTLDSTNADLYLNTAIINRSIGNLNESIKALTHYLNLSRQDADKWVILAQMHLQNKAISEALSAVNIAIDLSGDKGLYYFERAIIYHAQNKIDLMNQDIKESRINGYLGRQELARRMTEEEL